MVQLHQLEDRDPWIRFLNDSNIYMLSVRNAHEVYKNTVEDSGK